MESRRETEEERETDRLKIKQGLETMTRWKRKRSRNRRKKGRRGADDKAPDTDQISGALCSTVPLKTNLMSIKS